MTASSDNKNEKHEETTTKDRSDVRRVIIIGSGPAGLTAALYAARASLEPLVFEGDGFEGTAPGGQLMTTTEIENYPGFEHGVQGPEMMDIMRRQATRFGAECVKKRVTAVDLSQRPLRVDIDDEQHFAEAVIIATGASAKWLGLPSEEEYKGSGVSACATCDALFFKNKDVLVVGGGDTAMEEALFLAHHCKSVTIVHRREELRASKIMSDRARNNQKIKWLLDTNVIEVLGKKEDKRKFVTGARIRNTKSGEESEVATDGIFMAIGHKPNTELFRDIVDMDKVGYIRTRDCTTYTNVRGVFACGDCQDHVYRQAVTAAGTGCMAAMDAERFVESNPIQFAAE